MKLLASYAMFTDHNYHGRPVETSRVDVFISPDVELSPAMRLELEHAARQRLHSLAKRMPHRYWSLRA